MIKNYNVPLGEDQRKRIREAMDSCNSLAEITRQETVYRVLPFLLEDEVVLERYLMGIAAKITKQRRQISYQALIFRMNLHLTRLLTNTP